MEILVKLQSINDKLSRLAPKHLSLMSEREKFIAQIDDMSRHISSLEGELANIKSVNQAAVQQLGKLLEKLD